jgi:hypothetical protein
MKRELKALLLMLCPTERSTNSFIRLALEDDWEHERKSNSSFNLDKNSYIHSPDREPRRQQLKSSAKERQIKILLILVVAILVVPFAIAIGVEITGARLSQVATSVLIVILLRPFKLKTEERMFDGNDLLERTLDLGESYLFRLGILITVLDLFMHT